MNDVKRERAEISGMLVVEREHAGMPSRIPACSLIDPCLRAFSFQNGRYPIHRPRRNLRNLTATRNAKIEREGFRRLGLTSERGRVYFDIYLGISNTHRYVAARHVGGV